MGRMSEQPEGIDQTLAAGPSDADEQPDLDPADGRAHSTLRTDPDDPAEGMKEAQNASEGG